MGLAGSAFKPKAAKVMMENIVTDLIRQRSNGQMKVDALNFLQKIELLKALTTPGVTSGSSNHIACVKALCEQIDAMYFDIIANELRHDEFEILLDAYSNMKFSDVKQIRDIWSKSFTNESLKNALENPKMTNILYPESTAAEYDPIKPRVVGGITESILRADLKDLYVMKDGEGQGLNDEIYTFEPDVVMGYEGKKVGLYVLNDDALMRDTMSPCGFTKAKMQLVKQAHELTGMKSNVENIGVGVS